MTTKSLSSSAMLLDLNISTYTGRKQDKTTAAEVNLAKQSKNAASVYKSLFTEDPDLEAITAHAGKVRSWLYAATLPWSDSGTRLVPTKNFFDITHELAVQEQEFARLVKQFIDNFSTKVSAQAFKLGKLFDAREYPAADVIAAKFGFRYVFMPVPEVGDFRVDIPAEAQADLKSNFESTVQTRLQEALATPWERLYEEVTHIKNKMTDKEDGKPNKLYESMLENALALCKTLDALNILDDPDLDAARRALELSLIDVDIKSLRKSPEIRASLKSQMEELTDKFALEI